MDEQIKLSHKLVEGVDIEKRKICVTLLRCSVDKPESSYAQVRRFARMKEDCVFEIVYVNYKLEDIIYLLDVMTSVYDKVIANKPVCNVLSKVIALFYSLSLFVLFELG